MGLDYIFKIDDIDCRRFLHFNSVNTSLRLPSHLFPTNESESRTKLSHCSSVEVYPGDVLKERVQVQADGNDVEKTPDGEDPESAGADSGRKHRRFDSGHWVWGADSILSDKKLHKGLVEASSLNLILR